MRLLTHLEANEMETTWTTRWRFEIAPRPVKPGVWRLKGGGHLIRGKAKDHRTGKTKTILRALRQASAAEAYRTLQEELDRVRQGMVRQEAARTRFSEFAASLFERKVAKGEIRSAQTRENWEFNLRLHLLPRFGDFYLDAIDKADVEAWLAEQATRVQQRRLSPHTVNNWLRLLREIMNEAVDELDLPKNALAKVRPLDTSMHVTFTEEQPNALTPEEIPHFLAAMRERHPQHLAMTALGFATGWRPSMMRPLRRRGETADVLWDRGVILARRSQTRRDEVMEGTKNLSRFRLAVPDELLRILRWHADHLPAGPMRESDLLFPSTTGGFRSPTALGKPFEDLCAHLKLKKRITPKGMRRTFQDLARRAQVEGLVQRSICGHLTEEMTELYSSVGQDEVRAAIGKVVALAGYRDLLREGCETGCESPKNETGAPEAPRQAVGIK
ncbi:MAG: hypothetical protein SF187_02405 [Deltaproteobacteria bacterium]|nr:hypothetical protein [Deltaproteobacteria bacterium]